MMKGIYTAATGMVYQMEALNEVAGNLANVNTSGYKRTELVAESFDGLVTRFAQPAQGAGGLFDNRTGAGVMKSARARFDAQGPLQRTSNPLHLALTGPGYFQTVNQRGLVAVTRNGDFRMDAEGYLAAQSGERVLGIDNQPIPLGAVATESMHIREDGTILSGAQVVGRIKVVGAGEADPVSFPLSNANAPAVTEGFKVAQGYLENSNVSVISEMVNLINIGKAFNFGQKAITTQDNLLNKTVNDLGRIQ